MYLKILIIICLNIFDNEVKLKAILILILIIFYYFLLIMFVPYESDYLGYLDKLSILICYFTILFALLAHSVDKSQEYLLLMSYITILAINLIYDLKMLIELLQTITTQFEEKIEMVKEKIVKNIPFLRKIIVVKKKIKYRGMWRKARKWVLAYVRDKKLKDLDIGGTEDYISRVKSFKELKKQMTISLGTYVNLQSKKEIEFKSKNFNEDFDIFHGSQYKVRNSIELKISTYREINNDCLSEKISCEEFLI